MRGLWFKNNIFISLIAIIVDNRRGEILIAVAHPSEAEAVQKAVTGSGCGCEILVAGVGGASMSWALQKRFTSGTLPALVINPGIAGSYTTSLAPGDVVIPRSDCFADMGVDDNGTFLSLFSANMADPDRWPFSDGRIHCTGRSFDLLAKDYPVVTAATVNMASGSQQVIDRIRDAWNPDIETMEGAWLAYACAVMHIKWLSVRAVSNMVEPRNLKNWNIPLALSRLEKEMTGILRLIRTA
jgi:futalosine hydrolase